MKKLVLAIITLVGLLAITSTAQNQYMTNAQGQVYEAIPTNTVSGVMSTNPSAGALTEIYGYFTSFNTNYATTFSPSNNYQVWTGVSYNNSVFLGGLIGAEAQPFSGLRGFTLRTVETLAPQAGTLADAEIDFGYAFTYVDIRILPFFGVQLQNKIGSENQPEQAAFGGGLEFEKAMGKNSFCGVYGEATSESKGALTFGFITGVTF